MPLSVEMLDELRFLLFFFCDEDDCTGLLTVTGKVLSSSENTGEFTDIIMSSWPSVLWPSHESEIK